MIDKCKDQDVVNFWKETAAKISGEASLTNISFYILSKLNQLLINEYIKSIIVTKKMVMDTMSEARKYRLSLVLANQTLGQLSGKMTQSVLGNVGSTIFFQAGHQ